MALRRTRMENFEANFTSLDCFHSPRADFPEYEDIYASEKSVC